MNCGGITINGNDIVITVINPAPIGTGEAQPQSWERIHFAGKSEGSTKRDHWVQEDCRSRSFQEELDPENHWQKTTVINGKTLPKDGKSTTLWKKEGKAVEAEEIFPDQESVVIWKKLPQKQ